MKKFVAIILTLILAFSLVACGGGGNDGGGDDGGDGELAKVAFICKGYTDTFCLLVMDLFKEAAAQYSDVYTVEYFDGELDADKITQLIETCTASGFNAIVMQQQDADAPVAAIKEATAQGIFVIITVGKVNDDGESYYIDADPVQQARLLVDYAADQGIIEEGTKVAILQGPAAQFHATGRLQGFEEGLGTVGCEIIGNEIANWRQSEAQTIVENWLVAAPDLAVIFSSNDDMALGAIEAMKTANRDDIIVFGIDANEEGCYAVRDGLMKATVQQDAKGYAGLAAEFAATLIQGGAVESVQLDSVLITVDEVQGVIDDLYS